MKKQIGLIFAIIFFLFAAVQYNDPDPWVWIVIYMIVSVICLLQWLGKTKAKVLFFLAFILLLGALTYVPALFDWGQKGFPNIAGKMKTTEMHIELVRESFGLLICALALSYLGRFSRGR